MSSAAEPMSPWAIPFWRRWLPGIVVAGEWIGGALILQMMNHLRVDWSGGHLLGGGIVQPVTRPPSLNGNQPFDQYIRALRSYAAWESSCLLLCVVFLVVAVAAIVISRRATPVHWRWRVNYGWILAWLAIGTAAVLSWHGTGKGFRGAETVLAWLPDDIAGVVAGFIKVFNVVLIVACPFVVAAPAVSLLHVSSGSKAPLAETVKQRIEQLNLLLYLGALLLVAGTLEVWSFYSWPAAYVAKTDVDQFFALAKTMSTTMGCFFSLVLASIYIPTLAQLRLLRGDSVTPEDGNLSHWLRPMFNVGVILAPILAGVPLADVMKAVVGK